MKSLQLQWSLKIKTAHKKENHQHDQYRQGKKNKTTECSDDKNRTCRTQKKQFPSSHWSENKPLNYEWRFYISTQWHLTCQAQSRGPISSQLGTDIIRTLILIWGPILTTAVPDCYCRPSSTSGELKTEATLWTDVEYQYKYLFTCTPDP